MMGQLRHDLVVDVGNSRMKCGLFHLGRLVASSYMAHGDADRLAKWLHGVKLHRIALGTVASPDANFLEKLRAWAPVKEITGASPAPIRSLYGTPLTLGVDRLANAVAVASLFPDRSALAIDLGSCITYDLVDGLTVYRGGVISPGMHMRARALHAYSARLPEVLPQEESIFPGTDTNTSLAAGIHHGLRFELEGMIDAFRQQHPGLAVVLTGGDAPRFAKALKSGIFAHPSLTLIGLYALLHFDPNGDLVAPS